MYRTETMEKSDSIAVYHISMESGNELGVKNEFLLAAYSSIDEKARQLAPQEIRDQLLISQDPRVKTTFHVKVSNRMAPYLINAIQQQNDSGYGIALRSYFYRFQEAIMAQMFSNVEQTSFPKFS